MTLAIIIGDNWNGIMKDTLREECDEEYPCQGLGEHAHFRSFGMAFLTLFRIATGERGYTTTLEERDDPWDNYRRQLERNHEGHAEGGVR